MILERVVRWTLISIIAAMTVHLVWNTNWVGARTRLRTENYPLISVGMTRAEVEELLGGPPGNYGRHRGGTGSMTLEGVVVPPGSTELIWSDDTTRFEIYLNDRGRVVAHHKRRGYEQHPPEGVYDQLRRWLTGQPEPGRAVMRG